MFCAGGDPQDAQGSKKAKTMDYKEWVEMLKYLAVFDKKVKKQKAAEIFKQANRGTAGDGDHSELDWDEFEFAFRKLAEHLGCSRLPHVQWFGSSRDSHADPTRYRCSPHGCVVCCQAWAQGSARGTDSHDRWIDRALHLLCGWRRPCQVFRHSPGHLCCPTLACAVGLPDA
jgi:hypothetical protein